MARRGEIIANPMLNVQWRFLQEQPMSYEEIADRQMAEMPRLPTGVTAMGGYSDSLTLQRAASREAGDSRGTVSALLDNPSGQPSFLALLRNRRTNAIPENELPVDTPPRTISQLSDHSDGGALQGSIFSRNMAAAPTRATSKDRSTSPTFQPLMDLEEMQNDPSLNSPRSTSPIIIWRPTARVRLARDIPPELKSAFLEETSPTPSHVLSSAADLSSETSRSSRATAPKPRGRRHVNRPPPQEVQQEVSTRHRRNMYGAWYLPKNKWSCREEPEDSRAQSRIAVDYYNASTRTAANTENYNPVLMEKAAKLQGDIPSLYISKAYKSYLMENNPDRMPHLDRKSVV